MTTQKKKPKSNNEYKNYKLSRSSNDNKIDIISLDDPKVTKQWFHENYIKIRKPVLIKYNKGSTNFHVDLDKFKPNEIQKTFEGEDEDDDDLLQVEELNNGGFGSGQKRLKMGMGEFLSRINDGESLYLTTQYVENDPEVNDNHCCGDCDEEEAEDDDGEDDEEEEKNDREALGFAKFNSDGSDAEEFGDLDDDFQDDFQDADIEDEFSDPNLIYQPPLSKLLDNNNLKYLPPHAISLTESIIPQQINLWFGKTINDSNQLKIKYDSKDEISEINNGLPIKNASSTGLHHDHADNLYILVQGKKRFTLYSPDFANDLYTVGDVREVYDTGVIDYIRNEHAPNWVNVRPDGGCIESENDAEHVETDLDPPSFCKIPPSLLHLNEVEDLEQREKLIKYCDSKLPKFTKFKNNSMKVDLNDGDLLYLPAGWFHEVTSYGDELNNNVHVAINYWFVPPDKDDFENPYTDDTWNEDFGLWKKKFM